MKTFLLVIVIALVAAVGVVKAGPSCRREITQYTIQNLVCAEHGIEVQGFAAKIAEGDMTFDELDLKIASKCEKARSASCYNDISTPIAGSCNDAESVQHFRNAFKTVLTFNEFMCQNNGQKYLNFVQNDGAACYYNQKKAQCYTDLKNAANVGDLSFNDENVCAILDADWACLHHYDDCENEYVGKYYRQILESLREKFSC